MLSKLTDAQRWRGRALYIVLANSFAAGYIADRVHKLSALQLAVYVCFVVCSLLLVIYCFRRDLAALDIQRAAENAMKAERAAKSEKSS